MRLTVLLCLFSLFASVSAFALTEPVTVEGGRVSGVNTALAGVRAYKGIPYAAPPVGPLRWRPPQPVRPWNGIKDCSQFGAACPQPDSPLRDTPANQSEDCLTLNVWTAAHAADEKRPVMVWIHGGANVMGASSKPLYDGAQFASNGVVLVSINYRLGVFGYLASPLLNADSPRHVSGNYGILDQIAALRWVRRNIGRFGGDPANVTIFGESAGAVNVGILLVSPLSKGLFERAIMESGTPVAVQDHLTGTDPASLTGTQLFKALNATTVEEARARSSKELLDAIKVKMGPLSPGTMIGPVVDGWVIPDDPMKMLQKGRFHHVPVMLGTNANEGSLFTRTLPAGTPESYDTLIRRLYGAEAPDVLRLFPPGTTKTSTREAEDKLLTVAAFAAPARRVARDIGAVEPATYLYQFTRVSVLLRLLSMGATHGSEIPYVFNSIPQRFSRARLDHELGREMQAYWVQFAKTGDPNGAGRPKWPRYTAAGDAHLEFGDTVQVGHHLDQAACDLFDRIKPAHLPGRE